MDDDDDGDSLDTIGSLGPVRFNWFNVVHLVLLGTLGPLWMTWSSWVCLDSVVLFSAPGCIGMIVRTWISWFCCAHLDQLVALCASTLCGGGRTRARGKERAVRAVCGTPARWAQRARRAGGCGALSAQRALVACASFVCLCAR